ncbi:MAG: hypothetical protein V8R04_18165 [Bacteroides thetaiotaomicron]
MKIKTFYVMVICTSLSLIGCDKEEIDAPITPPIEKPDEPIASPSTNDIIKIKTGDIEYDNRTQMIGKALLMVMEDM